jgi:hypothetical protein
MRLILKNIPDTAKTISVGERNPVLFLKHIIARRGEIVVKASLFGGRI